MAKKQMVPVLMEKPEDPEENPDFRFSFQRALLRVLLKGGQLSRAQHEACVKKLEMQGKDFRREENACAEGSCILPRING